jgi:hypothetical protein
MQLKRLPNLNQASIAISKQITICGDLHGKLEDLLVIFHKVIPFIPDTSYSLSQHCIPTKLQTERAASGCVSHVARGMSV